MVVPFGWWWNLTWKMVVCKPTYKKWWLDFQGTGVSRWFFFDPKNPPWHLPPSFPEIGIVGFGKFALPSLGCKKSYSFSHSLEVENGYVWKVTILLEIHPFFDFHDYARKFFFAGKPLLGCVFQMIFYGWVPWDSSPSRPTIWEKSFWKLFETHGRVGKISSCLFSGFRKSMMWGSKHFKWKSRLSKRGNVAITCLGGGFNYIPRSSGKWSHMTSIFFRWVGKNHQPEASCWSESIFCSFFSLFTWGIHWTKKHLLAYDPSSPSTKVLMIEGEGNKTSILGEHLDL